MKVACSVMLLGSAVRCRTCRDITAPDHKTTLPPRARAQLAELVELAKELLLLLALLLARLRADVLRALHLQGRLDHRTRNHQQYGSGERIR